jgi:hypothetical protein
MKLLCLFLILLMSEEYAKYAQIGREFDEAMLLIGGE